MFGDLPKLFDRDFALGYLLPVVAFIGANLAEANVLGYSDQFTAILQTNILVGTTLVILVTYLGAVVLLGLNRDIYRFLEGYGHLNPLRVFHSLAEKRYRRLQQSLSSLDADYKSYITTSEGVPETVVNRRAEVLRILAFQYPDDAAWLLPTPLGNTIRSFEVYPRVMYGVESVEGWNRLLAVIPKDFRELVDASKARTDLWVNVCFLSLLFAIEFVLVSLVHSDRTSTNSIVWPALALVLAYVASGRARSAAEEWGNLFRASFDVFLGELAKRLGISMGSGSRIEERLMWQRFSQAITYALPDIIPGRQAADIPHDPPKS